MPVKPVIHVYSPALDDATGNVTDRLKGRRVKTMCLKLRWIKKSEKMSHDTGKELEMRECKLWKEKDVGVVELHEE